ncbi:ABC transporter ATP-binding protein [Roseomonas sp. GC11]|uniref:ABC transporter ATP-binding protein n=1 Tax=Roseomonas sp. GC11 TaxID=2950546 RepID=UPI002108E38A|nr:ABC transporter ATP-binding protein [Roseomonas sp. GC11]MCQ4161807.1 ABC transporter ATP-binding protein [Roseomonas sp. GC11]
MSLLSIEGLTVALPKGADRPHAIENLSLRLAEREILCVVGESGSGKSLTAGAVMGLLPEGVRATQGAILFEGRDLLGLPPAEMRRLRGARIGMVFQEPMTALNPLRSIGSQIGEMFAIHTSLSRREIAARALALLEQVRIPDPAAALRAYPHELSGGQRQRAMIAMALALEPKLLICDEPTTALDVTTQAQILTLIRELQQRSGTAVLFITHDFGVVADIADRVAVMHRGVMVEHGPAAEVLNHPRHAYTRALVAAVPPLAPPAAPLEAPVAAAPVLEVVHLSKTYRKGALLKRHRRVTHAVKDVSFSLPRGSTLGVVGESGSGKSTLARCIVRLLDPEQGEIRLEGQDRAALSRAELRREARRVQMVFQDPFASLNPRRRVGELVAQGPIIHGTPRAEAFARARELFALVGLDPAALDRFPHEFSGGQRQRIGLARALALRPDVLVADEPVSALDVSVQAQVLKLLARLRAQLGLSMVFITHDLRVAAQLCDSIVVMRHGEVVEAGVTAEVFARPRHPYTRALMAAVPGQNWTPPVAFGSEEPA